MALRAAWTVTTGNGAGVPVAVGGSVWVPNTFDGTLVRLDARTGEALSTLRYGSTPADADGYLDTAVEAEGSIWVASDYRATVTRVDPETGAAQAEIAVPPRPAAVAPGGRAVWAAHFLREEVTRIDPATNEPATFVVPDVHLVGVAYLDNAPWVLATRPAVALRLDPATGEVVQRIALDPPLPVVRRFIDAWWLAAGDSALWATLPTHDAVARIDPGGDVSYFETHAGRPFCTAAGGGSAWAATDSALVRIDGEVLPMAPAALSGFAQCAWGEGAAWFVNYDRGELTRVDL